MKIRISLLLVIAILFTWNCSQSQDKSNLTALEFSMKMEHIKAAQLLDVRTPREYAEGHLLNARNFDWNGDFFEQQIGKLDKTRPVLVYCLSGGRSASAARKMRSQGFKEVYELQGGFEQWKAARLPSTTD